MIEVREARLVIYTLVKSVVPRLVVVMSALYSALKLKLVFRGLSVFVYFGTVPFIYF